MNADEWNSIETIFGEFKTSMIALQNLNAATDLQWI